MNAILLTVGIIAGIGLLAGLLLSIASIVLAVPKDETAEKILEVLPGANCGACGFSGCAGYAAALSEGKTKETNLCAPGGAAAASGIADILGLDAGDFVRQTAVVQCQGSWNHTSMKMEYHGIATCAGANQLFSGLGACPYGCLGFGDCKNACPYDAITVENGLARVNIQKCKACGKCVAACPKNLISLTPVRQQAIVRCQNLDKGAKTRKTCEVGCIGCMKCVKACDFGAVTVDHFNATVDFEKCTACGACVAVCPQHCITDLLPDRVKAAE